MKSARACVLVTPRKSPWLPAAGMHARVHTQEGSREAAARMCAHMCHIDFGFQRTWRTLRLRARAHALSQADNAHACCKYAQRACNNSACWQTIDAQIRLPPS